MIRAFSSSSSQVKHMDDRTRALLFTSGLVSDSRKEVLKEYPKDLLTAIKLAREADETVQLLSSMDTQTTVGNGRNEFEQVPSAADGETSRHDQRGQVSRFGGRRRLTNNYSRRGSDASVAGKLAILLEIGVWETCGRFFKHFEQTSCSASQQSVSLERSRSSSLGMLSLASLLHRMKKRLPQ